MIRVLSAALALLAVIFASGTQARDWYFAETDNFRIYSESDEDDLRELAIELERLDQALRILSGIGPSEFRTPGHAKLTLYRFGDPRHIGELLDSRSVAGFFSARTGQSVAFTPERQERVRGLGQRATGLELDPRGVLFHEYAHFFMYQHSNAAYPFWYSEGFAELFYTAEFGEDRFTIGEPPASRAFALGSLRADTREMFEERQRHNLERIYGHGWLLTSFLLFDVDRRTQLNEYIRRLNSGEPSLAAAEAVFGDLDELDRQLDAYRRGESRLLRIPYYDPSTPSVSIRRLSQDEEDVMDLVVRSTAGVTEDQARRQVSSARRLVERYPDSLPVLRAAMEVEYDAGDLDEAEQLAERAHAVDANAIEAMLYRANIAMRRGAEDPAQYEAAREYFLAANAIDSTDPRALYGYYLNFAIPGEDVSQNAAIALEAAFGEAPYSNDVRSALAHWLLTEDRDDEARVVLGPQINNPHRRGGDRLRALFDGTEEDSRAELLEFLRPKPYGYEPPEDDDDD